MKEYEKLNGFVKHFSFISNINIEYSSKIIYKLIKYTDTLIEALQNSIRAWETP
jgi:hypothetical protein